MHVVIIVVTVTETTSEHQLLSEAGPISSASGNARTSVKDNNTVKSSAQGT